MAKVINVFYNAQGLPFKDKELTTHFPIVGGAFQGADNTTEIRFYVDNLGANRQWCVFGKLPNGKKGFKVLTESVLDEDEDRYYPFMLSSFFLQYKGDLYLSLGGYYGNIVELNEEQEYELQQVSGEMTGAIKLQIAYSVQMEGSDYDELPQWLQALGSKLDINKGIVVIPNPSATITGYQAGQLFYSQSDKTIYELVDGSLSYVVDLAKYENDIGFLTINIEGELYLTSEEMAEVEKKTCIIYNTYYNEVFYKSHYNDSADPTYRSYRFRSFEQISTNITDHGDNYTRIQIPELTIYQYNNNKVERTYATYNYYNRGQANTRFAVKSDDNTFTGSNVFNTSPQTNEQIGDSSADTKLTTKKYVKDLMDEHLGDYDTLKGRVDTIESEIPSQASNTNQLADRDWVNSTINSLVAFYITKNAQGDPFATYSELMSATTFYSGGQVRVPTRNDYCLVVADETHPIQANDYTTFNNTNDYVGYYVLYDGVLTLVTQDNKNSLGIVVGTTIAYITNASTCRYIYQGTQWEFQFIVNETPFTSDQIKAINSGITDTLVAQITTNANNITTINGKLPIIKDYVVATNLWQLVGGKYVAELSAGNDFIINDNAMHLYTPTSNNDQLLRDTYGINVSSDATTQKFTFTCNIGNSAPSEVINFTIAQFGGN